MGCKQMKKKKDENKDIKEPEAMTWQEWHLIENDNLKIQAAKVLEKHYED